MYIHVIIIIQTVNVGNATNIVNRRILYIVTDVLVQCHVVTHTVHVVCAHIYMYMYMYVKVAYFTVYASV